MRSDQPFIRWEWIGDNRDQIWDQTVQHLELTLIAVGIGFLLAMVLSLLGIRFRRLYAPITSLAGILYTIPSLALFAFFVPITGLSTTTAEIGLVSYTLLILIRNITAGLDAVPPSVREAARGLGYRQPRLFWEVELPLAVPSIIAGLRIATVTVIGLVTVTSIITLGGLGLFILDGLRRDFLTPLLVGTVLTILLAVALDAALLLAERWLTPAARATRGADATEGGSATS